MYYGVFYGVSAGARHTHTYFIFALVTPAECALHGVAALYPDLSPYDNTCRRLFRALHDEAAAAHAEGWSDLGQDLRKSLENKGKHSRRGILLLMVNSTGQLLEILAFNC